MMLLPRSVRIYAAREPANLRKSFEGLSNEVRAVLGLDPLCGPVCWFLNRRRTRVKLLLWTRGGYDRAQAVGAWALHVSRPRGCGDDGGGDRRARTVDAARRAGAQAGSERDAVGAGVSRDGLTKSEKSCRRGVDRGSSEWFCDEP